MSLRAPHMFDYMQSAGVALPHYDSKMMQREGGLELAQWKTRTFY